MADDPDIQVGFNGYVKVGRCFPVAVNQQEALGSRAVAESVDPEGRAVRFALTSEKTQDGKSVFRGICKIGRIDAPLRFRGVGGSPGKAIDSGDATRLRLKQSALLVATLGKPGGFPKLAEADEDDNSDDRSKKSASKQPRPVLEGIHVVELDSSRQLPVDSLGYDTLDILVISGKYDLDRRRSIALRRWIRNGGHLIFCRGSELDTFIQVSSGNVKNVDPEHISRWLPIKIVDQSFLRDLGGIETYAARKTAIIFSGRARAARLEDLAKLTHGGVTVLATGIDGPLFVRMAYGFGKITFCGLDFHRPPLLNWREVGSIARRIVNDAHPGLASAGRVSTSRRLARSGVTDLGTQLNAIQQEFPEIQRASTIWTMLWLVLFIICIGPIDYFLVHRVLRRPRLTWITFPLMVVAVSYLAFRDTNPVGDKPALLNQLEIVDIDATRKQELVRVNAWMTLFSPETRRYRLSLEPADLINGIESPKRQSNDADRSTMSLLTWDGVTENTYGGMYRTSGVSFDRLGYDINPQASSLGDLPVKVRSTASLKATSYYQGTQIIDAGLSANTVGDLSGTLQHQLGAPIEDWILVYGSRIYFPGTDERKQIASGEKWSPVGQGVKTADLRSTLTGVRLSKEQKTDSKGSREISEQADYDPHSRDPQYLLRILSFHDAAGGYEYTGLNHHALGGLELSGLLHLQRAILIGRIKLPASRLLRHNEESTEGTVVTAQRRHTFIRVVLPVRQAARNISDIKRRVLKAPGQKSSPSKLPKTLPKSTVIPKSKNSKSASQPKAKRPVPAVKPRRATKTETSCLPATRLLDADTASHRVEYSRQRRFVTT